MYHILRWLIGLGLGFYFRRIERFHSDRVPAKGPVLFTSNHPNSLTDSFVIGATVPRKVNFVATVQLFRIRPLKWILTRCGVIPINRVKDDRKAMRTVADTFEACFRVLESGQAVGIFPEGITYEDEQLKEIKSGAARMALELEARHQGQLGLRIIPVGLTYSAKELYRSDVLASFGEPICVANFLDGYEERRKDCIHKLTAEIERRIQSLILHLPELHHARIVDGVKRLYLERLRVGSGIAGEAITPRAEELVLSQRIAAVIHEVHLAQPERAAAFVAKLKFYQRWLERFSLSDEGLKNLEDKTKMVRLSFLGALVAVCGAPIALYGWAHRAIPYWLVKLSISRFTERGKRKSQTAVAAIAAGLVIFGVLYGSYISLFHSIFGWPASLWYGLTLPVASLIAHYYLREVRRLAACVRNASILLRAPAAAHRLLRLREELIAEIESVQVSRRPKNESIMV